MAPFLCLDWVDTQELGTGSASGSLDVQLICDDVHSHRFGDEVANRTAIAAVLSN